MEVFDLLEPDHETTDKATDLTVAGSILHIIEEGVWTASGKMPVHQVGEVQVGVKPTAHARGVEIQNAYRRSAGLTGIYDMFAVNPEMQQYKERYVPGTILVIYEGISLETLSIVEVLFPGE